MSSWELKPVNFRKSERDGMSQVEQRLVVLAAPEHLRQERLTLSVSGRPSTLTVPIATAWARAKQLSSVPVVLERLRQGQLPLLVSGRPSTFTALSATTWALAERLPIMRAQAERLRQGRFAV